MLRKLTAMNFFMVFATSAASLVLGIGRRFAVKSAVLICNTRKTNKGLIDSVDLPLIARVDNRQAGKGVWYRRHTSSECLT